ncbi:unnamed protein product [Triticum turgidum subsp. durum]|uniref:Uncharacterized protein n=1 Tax=Triticum turgidum subsp. durum TaxID=4567 RepID=A0A9R0WTQ4_TRITD|nr:unnamed protein product [Triticum turgidum subsp. durum]
MPVDGGELGVLELLDANLHLWKRKIDRDGVVSWVLGKTIGLEELLYIDKRKMGPMMLGYCEDNNVVFIWTYHGIFMVQLESLEVYKPPIQTFYCLVHPFTSVYTAAQVFQLLVLEVVGSTTAMLKVHQMEKRVTSPSRGPFGSCYIFNAVECLKSGTIGLTNETVLQVSRALIRVAGQRNGLPVRCRLRPSSRQQACSVNCDVDL